MALYKGESFGGLRDHSGNGAGEQTRLKAEISNENLSKMIGQPTNANNALFNSLVEKTTTERNLDDEGVVALYGNYTDQALEQNSICNRSQHSDIITNNVGGANNALSSSHAAHSAMISPPILDKPGLTRHHHHLNHVHAPSSSSLLNRNNKIAIGASFTTDIGGAKPH